VRGGNAPAWTLAPQVQAVLAVQAVYFLVIDHQSFPAKQCMNPLLPVPESRPGDLPNPHAHMRVIRAPADVPAG